MKKYLVGGAVRDTLLKLPIKEKDWVVVGLTTQKMLNMGYEQVGKGFPVFLHPKNHEEYALARTEKKTGYGHTGFICNTTPQTTLQEDLYRRDLTINAMALDKNGNIIDPYNGQKDIKLRVLRHVSILFKEDPLRVLRVARFAAKFFHMNFHIASDTLILMKKMTKELSHLPPERIWTETKKALTTQNPQIYFQVLRKCKALKIIFPEIDKLFYIPSSIKNTNTDAGTHTMQALKVSEQLTNDMNIRFAILCHDLGKGKTPKEEWPYHYGHENNGIKIINNLCQRLKIENSLCKFAKKIAKYHSTLHNIETVSSKKIMKLLHAFNVWKEPEKLKQIILIGKSNIQQNYKNNNIYPQETFLKQAFLITQSININKIIKDGYKKIEISKELYNRRKSSLQTWKMNITKNIKKHK